VSFWDTTIQFFWHEESALVLGMALGLAFLLLYFIKEERRSVINTLGFFFACLFGQFLSSLIHAMKFHMAASMLHEAFIIGGGIALIRLWRLLVFRVVLPFLRVSPLDLGSIVATSAMITAVVAFAMQDTLGNILGGLALQLDNSIQVGDWIKVDDLVGRVVDIRWRSTLVETRNWETVVFPNSQLMKNKFLVLGRRSDQAVQLRRWIWFGVSLDVTPSKVVNAVEGAILQAEINNVAKRPAPNCVLMEMDKGYARYALRYWLADLGCDDATDGAVRWHVYTALKRAGIKLAVEEQNVHYIRENEKYEEATQQRDLLRRVKTLKRVELFKQMTDDELHKLAARLKYAPFAKGNVITKQGTDAQYWLFIIINGEVEVYLEAANGEKRRLNVLTKGDFFGEMSLMTGAPRLASVIATTDVECYRLNKGAFEEIMRDRPSIAEEISNILVERRAQLDSAMQVLNEEPLDKQINRQHNEVLAAVKRFFGL
jgi:small-conductance mechanosensitive channel/CRP-like cAMP-binding protein